MIANGPFPLSVLWAFFLPLFFLVPDILQTLVNNQINNTINRESFFILNRMSGIVKKQCLQLECIVPRWREYRTVSLSGNR